MRERDEEGEDEHEPSLLYSASSSPPNLGFPPFGPVYREILVYVYECDSWIKGNGDEMGWGFALYMERELLSPPQC